MTDIPHAALLSCGKTDIGLHNAALVGGILHDALTAAGIPVNARCSLRLMQPIPFGASAVQNTLDHLLTVSDLVITVGGVGFDDSDVLPAATSRLCPEKADYFAGILCGAAAPVVPDAPSTAPDPLPPFIPASERRAREKRFDDALSPLALLSRLIALPHRRSPDSKVMPQSSPAPRRVHPSRATAGIRHGSLLLNFPDDVSDARLLIDALLPSVCYCVFRLCGKSAAPVNVCDDLVNDVPFFHS